MLVRERDTEIVSLLSTSLMSRIWILLAVFIIILPIVSFKFDLKFTAYSRLANYYGVFEEPDSKLLSKLKKENSARILESELYLASLPSNTKPVPIDEVELVICIVTLSRKTGDGYIPRYLFQSAAAYHKETSDYYRENAMNNMTVALILCDVEDKDGDHPDVDNLQQCFPIIRRRERDPSSVKKVSSLEREKQDYAFCLEAAMKQYNTSQAVLMVEDDSLPLPGLLHNLRDMLARRSHYNTAFIKLFHPQRLLGYIQPEPHRWVEWVSLALLLMLLDHLLFRGTPPSFSLPFLLKLILVMLLLEVVGRQTILDLRPNYYLVPAPDCCTPANLFPVHNIPKVISTLANITCKKNMAKDYALVEMVSITGLQSWSVQPNLVRHVGAVSSLHTDINVHIQS